MTVKAMLTEKGTKQWNQSFKQLKELDGVIPPDETVLDAKTFDGLLNVVTIDKMLFHLTDGKESEALRLVNDLIEYPYQSALQEDKLDAELYNLYLKGLMIFPSNN